MTKVNIAGLQIDSITKKEFLSAVLARIKHGQKTFVTTPYSEFLYATLQDPNLLSIFNMADFAVADGIGIFWAKKYLSLPLTAKSFWGKVFQAWWQMKYSLAAIIFYPRWIKSALPEKIVGADLVWDLAKMASENNLSIFLLGGFGNTPELAKQKLISQFPNLSISVSNKNPDNASVVEDINRTSSDILFVAYGPIKQEKWIADNLASLDIKLAVGVGGSFDYIAGTKSAPPKFIRYAGLEWLWRLITQPYRLKRIINATFGLVNNTVLFKINSAMSLRKNVACVIINNENKILTCQRNPKPQKGHSLGEGLDKFKNYWQLPQGGIDAGEDLILAAKREAYEETGLKNLEFIKTSEKTNNYHFPPQWGKVFQKHYRFSGQSQNIVYLKFAGNNNEVKVDNREFVNYQWADVNKLSQLVHNERLNLIKIITEDLKDLA